MSKSTKKSHVRWKRSKGTLLVEETIESILKQIPQWTNQSEDNFVKKLLRRFGNDRCILLKIIPVHKDYDQSRQYTLDQMRLMFSEVLNDERLKRG